MVDTTYEKTWQGVRYVFEYEVVPTSTNSNDHPPSCRPRVCYMRQSLREIRTRMITHFEYAPPAPPNEVEIMEIDEIWLNDETVMFDTAIYGYWRPAGYILAPHIQAGIAAGDYWG